MIDGFKALFLPTSSAEVKVIAVTVLCEALGELQRETTVLWQDAKCQHARGVVQHQSIGAHIKVTWGGGSRVDGSVLHADSMIEPGNRSTLRCGESQLRRHNGALAAG
eukprot:6488457-Amphidinium_carterae.1